jgi:hypothetical protein
MSLSIVEVTLTGLFVVNVLLTTSYSLFLYKRSNTIDKDIRLKDSPMKFNVPGKLELARIKTKNNVENTG